MTQPTKDFEEQTHFGKKLTSAQTKLIRSTSESARKPKRAMLDEDDEDLPIRDNSFESLFDDPEK